MLHAHWAHNLLESVPAGTNRDHWVLGLLRSDVYTHISQPKKYCFSMEATTFVRGAYHRLKDDH